MTPDQIERKYRGRAKKILLGLRKALLEDNPDQSISLPFVLDDDDFRLEMVLGEEPDRIDISLQFCASEHWDGEKGGINFMVDVVHESGRMIGGLTPYNYTDRVWVPRSDPQAVEERFRVLESADTLDLVYLISEWKKRNLS